MASAFQSIIDQYELEPHKEGGYFKRIFTSSQSYGNTDQKIASSIYYLLTAQNSIGHLHTCKSDILHYFLEGDPLAYYVLSEKQGLKTYSLNKDERFLHVRGGDWKASQLIGGEYALIAEVVIPEFCDENWRVGSIEQIKQIFPEYFNEIKHLILRQE